MSIKQRYNNVNERMEDNAQKAVLPLLESKFISELGLKPRLFMEYDSANKICKVSMVFSRRSNKWEIDYQHHKQIISYPGYTDNELSQLVHKVAEIILGNLQDISSLSPKTDIKEYALLLYEPCMVDEFAFLPWLDQLTNATPTLRDVVLNYIQNVDKDTFYDGPHTTMELDPCYAIAQTFTEDEVRSMSPDHIKDLFRLVTKIKELSM